MKRISILFLILVTLASCSKYMEETPQNKLKPSSTADYEQLMNHGYITEQVMPFVDMASDDIILKEEDHVMPDADPSDFMVSAYMWDSSHETTMGTGDMAFAALYESIFYCNVVIENIQNAKGVTLDAKEVVRSKNNIEGEARVLRAYSYFYLANLYAQPYDPATAAETPGVPINESTAAPAKDYTRNTLAEVYDYILADINKGIELMEANPIENKGKFKFNVTSAKFLLSRVALYMQNYDLALSCAKDVLAVNNHVYDLREFSFLDEEQDVAFGWNENTVPGEDYLAKDHENIIFINGLSEVQPMLSFWTPMTTFSVNPDLAACYEDNDIRRWYFMHTYQQDTYAGFREKLSYAKHRDAVFCLGYPSEEDGYTRTFRIEEAYLNAAEAAAQLGDAESAVKYLNKERMPKFREDTYEDLNAADFTKDSLIEFILLERRREFCFEGQRWFDLRRTTRPAMKRLGYGKREASLEKDDLRYTFQIPDRELKLNPAIGRNPR